MKEKFPAFLKQGLSPEKLALCVALGSVIGVFPRSDGQPFFARRPLGS